MRTGGRSSRSLRAGAVAAVLAMCSCMRLGFGDPAAALDEDLGGPGMPALDVAAGEHHSCAISAAGGVWCWGANSYGQLGDATWIDSARAVLAIGLESDVQRVVAGHKHSCALTEAGEVRCWGDSYHGQLGLGDERSRSAPIHVAGIGGVATDVAAGDLHSCAVVAAGGVRCWGYNSYYQLGNGSNAASSTPVDVVGLGGPVTAVVAGGHHSCAVTEAGAAKCWGLNNHGQLGAEVPDSSATPVDVQGLGAGVLSMALGYKHSCALLEGGAVRCWGGNWLGQLGDGSTDDSTTPVEVTDLHAAALALAAGNTHTCAALVSGAVQCWGSNDMGQLGDGSREDRLSPAGVIGLQVGIAALAAGPTHTCARSAQGQVLCWGWNNSQQLGVHAPSPLVGPTRVTELDGQAASVSAGEYHTCALRTDGRALCWGNNDHVRLGQEGLSFSSAPLAVAGLGSPQGLSAGGAHSCAVSTSGSAHCWGYNEFGQLGDGSTNSRVGAVTVLGLDSGAAAVETGGYHSCAVTQTGALKCWGHNSYGQLGNASNTSAHSPVDVVGLNAGVTAVSAGGSGAHTCAVASGGTLLCWGRNADGQLGVGDLDSRDVPSPVVGMASVTLEVGTGHEHSCALTTTGAVKCWGSNSEGKLGDGSWYGSSTPVDVVGLDSGVRALAVGERHACAITAAGELRCWGDNRRGQLGDGAQESRRAPTLMVALERELLELDAGGEHTCAITDNRDLYCWGSNTYGQAGGPGAWSLTPIEIAGFTPGF